MNSSTLFKTTTLISILLVSHNNQKELALLLPSLKIALKGFESEILLVDNCSNDSTIEFVKNNFPDIIIIKNKKVLGYGANQNQNIAKAMGKFILLMNPDMIVPHNLFHIMLQFMKGHPDAGVGTCKICNTDGSCQYLNKREPTIFDLFIRRFFPLLKRFLEFFRHILPAIKRFLPSNFLTERMALYEMQDVGYDNVVDVPFISGSFIFARTDLIKEINGFDERFFMYFEDVDLCRRVRTKARCLYCPDVSVIHRWERASHKSLKWTFIFALSGLKYFYKWGFKFY